MTVPIMEPSSGLPEPPRIDEMRDLLVELRVMTSGVIIALLYTYSTPAMAESRLATINAVHLSAEVL